MARRELTRTEIKTTAVCDVKIPATEIDPDNPSSTCLYHAGTFNRPAGGQSFVLEITTEDGISTREILEANRSQCFIAVSRALRSAGKLEPVKPLETDLAKKPNTPEDRTEAKEEKPTDLIMGNPGINDIPGEDGLTHRQRVDLYIKRVLAERADKKHERRIKREQNR